MNEQQAPPIVHPPTTEPDYLVVTHMLALDALARRMHPTDLYAQTVVVMGYDPLARR